MLDFTKHSIVSKWHDRGVNARFLGLGRSAEDEGSDPAPGLMVGITELEDLLNVLEVTVKDPPDQTIPRHIFHGITPGDLKPLVRDADTKIWDSDPTFSIIARAVRDQQMDQGSNMDDKAIAIDAVRSMAKGADGYKSAVVDVLKIILAELLFISSDEIGIKSSLLTYGIDSMIAAQLRKFVSDTFDSDIPTSELLQGSLSIDSLSERIIIG